MPLPSIVDPVSKSRRQDAVSPKYVHSQRTRSHPHLWSGNEARVSCRVSRGSGPHPAPHWRILGRALPLNTSPHPHILICLFTNEDEVGGYWQTECSDCLGFTWSWGHLRSPQLTFHVHLLHVPFSLLCSRWLSSLLSHHKKPGEKTDYHGSCGLRSQCPPHPWDARNRHTGVRTASRQAVTPAEAEAGHTVLLGNQLP